MSNLILKYDLDLTARSETHYIQDEPHILQPGINRAVVPKYGAFYTKDLIVRDADTGQVLTLNDQYVPAMYWEEPSIASGYEVHGMLIITDGSVSNNVTVSYRLVGGNYVNITSLLLDLIENLDLDNREVSYGDLLGRPDFFPPAEHLHDLGDIYGFEYVVQSLESIRQAILTGDRSSHDELSNHIETRYQEALAAVAVVQNELDGHEARHDDPHQVTKAQVGLGNVENYPMAGTANAVEGVSNINYMSPLRTKEAIDAQAIIPLNQHTARTDNPHNVTKAQVGLSNVENYSRADYDARYVNRSGDTLSGDLTFTGANPKFGTSVDSDFTLVRNNATVAFITSSEIRFFKSVNPSADATLDLGGFFRWRNVHAVEFFGGGSNITGLTKAQVGLSAVDNYSRTHYDVRYGLQGLAGDQHRTNAENDARFALQTGDYSNLRARATTKDDVGLGNVPNYPMAGTANAVEGVSDINFMSPLRTKEAIDAQAITPLNAHTSRTDNPHNVTKAQVGLGNVDNYSRTDYDARYLRIGAVIDTTISGSITIPVAETSGGQHFAAAIRSVGADTGGLYIKTGDDNSDELALEIVNHLNETVLRVVGTTGNTDVGGILRVKDANDNYQEIFHANNPPTKAQVGLSNVQNYAMASTQEAIDGILGSAYMSPLRTKEAIDAQAMSAIQPHIADNSNPHNVTKAQVGLGSVNNYPMAVTQEAIDGFLNSAYMSPVRTKEAINAQAIVPLNAHTSRTDNPHQVTKAQVGLGSVQNYAMASTQEAIDGIFGSAYMSPLRTKEAIDAQAVVPLTNQLNAHSGNTSNPHNVTKSQVGLSNVQNYGIAPQPDAEIGVATTGYMTPIRTAQAIAAQAIVPLNQHAARTDNPHSVTKAQVGLGNVNNFPVATEAQAEDNTNTSTYITPWSWYRAFDNLNPGRRDTSNVWNGVNRFTNDVQIHTNKVIDTSVHTHIYANGFVGSWPVDPTKLYAFLEGTFQGWNGYGFHGRLVAHCADGTTMEAEIRGLASTYPGNTITWEVNYLTEDSLNLELRQPNSGSTYYFIMKPPKAVTGIYCHLVLDQDRGATHDMNDPFTDDAVLKIYEGVGSITASVPTVAPVTVIHQRRATLTEAVDQANDLVILTPKSGRHLHDQAMAPRLNFSTTYVDTVINGAITYFNIPEDYLVKMRDLSRLRTTTALDISASNTAETKLARAIDVYNWGTDNFNKKISNWFTKYAGTLTSTTQTTVRYCLLGFISSASPESINGTIHIVTRAANHSGTIGNVNAMIDVAYGTHDGNNGAGYVNVRGVDGVAGGSSTVRADLVVITDGSSNKWIALRVKGIVNTADTYFTGYHSNANAETIPTRLSWVTTSGYSLTAVVSDENVSGLNLGKLSTKWSGQASSIDLDTLTEGFPGDGLYVVRTADAPEKFGTIYLINGKDCFNVIDSSTNGHTYVLTKSSANVLTYERRDGAGGNLNLSFRQLLKVG